MTQGALKKDLLDHAAELAQPQISEAMSSIRDTIKSNLEQGFDHFSGPQKAAGEVLTMETQIPGKTLKTADVFYLTDVLEADGSITTLEKKGKTGMSDTETKVENIDASAVKESIETPVTKTVTEPGTFAAPATEPAADFEIGGDAPALSTPSVPAPDLASQETMVESAAAFSELATMARQLSAAPKVVSSEPVTPETTGGYTVDALMREMLRPMLKEWLDAHLPSLVKWLVTEQIEKMLKDQLGVVATPVAAAPVASEPAVESVVETTPVADVPVEESAADPAADMDFDTPAEAS